MNKKEIKLGPALTWDELADAYKEMTGASARIHSMNSIFAWAERQKTVFKISKEGTVHKIL